MTGISPFAYWRRRLGSALMRLASPQRQLAHSIANVRHDMAALGFPLCDLSDEELIAGLRRAGETMRACGVTVDEVRRGLARGATPSPTCDEEKH